MQAHFDKTTNLALDSFATAISQAEKELHNDECRLKETTQKLLEKQQALQEMKIDASIMQRIDILRAEKMKMATSIATLHTQLANNAEYMNDLSRHRSDVEGELKEKEAELWSVRKDFALNTTTKVVSDLVELCLRTPNVQNTTLLLRQQLQNEECEKNALLTEMKQLKQELEELRIQESKAQMELEEEEQKRQKELQQPQLEELHELQLSTFTKVDSDDKLSNCSKMNANSAILTKNYIIDSDCEGDDIHNVKEQNVINDICISTQPSLSDLKSHLNIIHNNMEQASNMFIREMETLQKQRSELKMKVAHLCECVELIDREQEALQTSLKTRVDDLFQLHNYINSSVNVAELRCAHCHGDLFAPLTYSINDRESTKENRKTKSSDAKHKV